LRILAGEIVTLTDVLREVVEAVARHFRLDGTRALALDVGCSIVTD
jgi:hypothetical protein